MSDLKSLQEKIEKLQQTLEERDKDLKVAATLGHSLLLEKQELTQKLANFDKATEAHIQEIETKLIQYQKQNENLIKEHQTERAEWRLTENKWKKENETLKKRVEDLQQLEEKWSKEKEAYMSEKQNLKKIIKVETRYVQTDQIEINLSKESKETESLNIYNQQLLDENKLLKNEIIGLQEKIKELEDEKVRLIMMPPELDEGDEPLSFSIPEMPDLLKTNSPKKSLLSEVEDEKDLIIKQFQELKMKFIKLQKLARYQQQQVKNYQLMEHQYQQQSLQSNQSELLIQLKQENQQLRLSLEQAPILVPTSQEDQQDISQLEYLMETIQDLKKKLQTAQLLKFEMIERNLQLESKLKEKEVQLNQYKLQLQVKDEPLSENEISEHEEPDETTRTKEIVLKELEREEMEKEIFIKQLQKKQKLEEAEKENIKRRQQAEPKKIYIKKENTEKCNQQ